MTTSTGIDDITEEISRINAFAKELEAELDMSLISPQHNIKLDEDEGEADGDGEDGVHDLSKELVLYSCHITESEAEDEVPVPVPSKSRSSSFSTFSGQSDPKTPISSQNLSSVFPPNIPDSSYYSPVPPVKGLDYHLSQSTPLDSFDSGGRGRGGIGSSRPSSFSQNRPSSLSHNRFVVSSPAGTTPLRRSIRLFSGIGGDKRDSISGNGVDGMLRILALKSKDEQDNASLVGGRSLCGVHSEEEKERGFVEEKGGRSTQDVGVAGRRAGGPSLPQAMSWEQELRKAMEREKEIEKAVERRGNAAAHEKDSIIMNTIRKQREEREREREGEGEGEDGASERARKKERNTRNMVHRKSVIKIQKNGSFVDQPDMQDMSALRDSTPMKLQLVKSTDEQLQAQAQAQAQKSLALREADKQKEKDKIGVKTPIVAKDNGGILNTAKKVNGKLSVKEIDTIPHTIKKEEDIRQKNGIISNTAKVEKEKENGKEKEKENGKEKEKEIEKDKEKGKVKEKEKDREAGDLANRRDSKFIHKVVEGDNGVKVEVNSKAERVTVVIAEREEEVEIEVEVKGRKERFTVSVVNREERKKDGTIAYIMRREDSVVMSEVLKKEEEVMKSELQKKKVETVVHKRKEKVVMKSEAWIKEEGVYTTRKKVEEKKYKEGETGGASLDVKSEKDAVDVEKMSGKFSRRSSGKLSRRSSAKLSRRFSGKDIAADLIDVKNYDYPPSTTNDVGETTEPEGRDSADRFGSRNAARKRKKGFCYFFGCHQVRGDRYLGGGCMDDQNNTAGETV